MNEPRRLSRHDEGEERELGRWVREARRHLESDRAQHAAVWWRVRESLSAPDGLKSHRWIAALAGAVVVVAVLAIALLSRRDASLPTNDAPRFAVSTQWNGIEIPEIGTFESSPGSEVVLRDRPEERQIELGPGRYRAAILRQAKDRPVVLITPHLRVVVLGTRLEIEVAAPSTRVGLIEGSVRVEGDGGAAVLAPNESIRSDDPRLAAPLGVPSRAQNLSLERPEAQAKRSARRLPERSLPSAPRPPRCEEQADREEALDCLGARAAGDDLSSQNALYTMGLLMQASPKGQGRALETFELFERRFPEGALAPEAASKRLEILIKLGRHAEAIEAASRFEGKYPGDPRTPRVALIRAGLLCREGQIYAARELLARLGASSDSAIAGEAARLERDCLPDDPAPP